jgi:hypothetical protein
VYSEWVRAAAAGSEFDRANVWSQGTMGPLRWRSAVPQSATTPLIGMGPMTVERQLIRSKFSDPATKVRRGGGGSTSEQDARHIKKRREGVTEN